MNRPNLSSLNTDILDYIVYLETNQHSNGTGKICSKCGEHMVGLGTINKRACSCGESDWDLKPGVKSTLEDGKVGK
jgi:hypothetical protein